MSRLIESHKRSVLKAFSWRIIATLTTVTISWFITHNVKFAVSIGVIEFFAKLVIYYAHERLWAHAKV
jgi:uncharacterized membrane protein